jgi:hypothetical protein
MAQTGYTPILIYSSSTTTNVPAAGSLNNSTLGAELAINITDGKLFYKDNSNVVQVIGWKTVPVTAGGTGLTSLTTGYIPFGNGTSAFGSDSQLFWDNSNKRLGINNTSPAYSVDINGTFRNYSTFYLNQQYSGGSSAGFINCDNTAGGGGLMFWGRYRDLTGISADGVRMDCLNSALNTVVPAAIRANPFVVFGGGGEAFRADSNSYLLVGYTSSNGAYRLQVNSQIFATSSTIATSDGNYKDEQTPITNALPLVMQLQPKTFRWKQGQAADGVPNPNFGKPKTVMSVEMQPNENGDMVPVDKKVESVDEQQWLREPHNFPDGVNIGFIAQEVAETLKDQPYVQNIVKKNIRSAIFDDAGNKIAPESEFLGIAEGNMIALLTAAIKELKNEFDQYKATHP